MMKSLTMIALVLPTAVRACVAASVDHLTCAPAQVLAQEIAASFIKDGKSFEVLADHTSRTVVLDGGAPAAVARSKRKLDEDHPGGGATCLDSDDGATDSEGYGCGDYVGYTHLCAHV